MIRYLFPLCFLLASVFAYAQEPRYKEGEILVRFRHSLQDIKSQELKKNFHLESTSRDYRHIKGLGLFKVQKGFSIKEAMRTLRKHPNVLYAEPNYFLHTKTKAQEANDPRLNELWGLENPNDIDINAKSAWEMTTGSENVIVATIDTGLDYTHDELKDNVWVNTLEIAGNGVDDDHNGYIDDVHGINVTSNTGDPMDDNSHGTHVAGTISAKGNNGIGIAGVSWNTRVLPCKFLDASGSGTLDGAIACLDYIAALATRKEAPVHVVASNNSYGGGGFSQALYDAIAQHNSLGILFMAAAGNESANNDNTESYPANYQLANIISVAALDRDGNLADFSNYGASTVHVAAPGVDIVSSIPGNAYDSYSGTSMATPHVVGLASLIAAAHPEYSAAQIKSLIISSGKGLSSLQGKVISGRMIRAFDVDGTGALSCQNQHFSQLITPKSNKLVVLENSPIRLEYASLTCENPYSSSGIDVSLDDSQNTTLHLIDDGTQGDTTALDGIYTGSYTASAKGLYHLRFSANDSLEVKVVSSQDIYTAKNIDGAYKNIAGKQIAIYDESVISLQTPFPLHFGSKDANYNTLYVTDNGTISVSDALVLYEAQQVPTASFNTLLAPFWEDFDPFNYISGTDAALRPFLSYAVQGTAPSRQLIIEWKNFPSFDLEASPRNAATFQVIFYEDNARIRVNYQDADFGNANFDKGQGASIGAQIASSLGLSHSFKEAKIQNDSSLLFFIPSEDDGVVEEDNGDAEEIGTPDDPTDIPVDEPVDAPDEDLGGDTPSSGGESPVTDEPLPTNEDAPKEETGDTLHTMGDAPANGANGPVEKQNTVEQTKSGCNANPQTSHERTALLLSWLMPLGFLHLLSRRNQKNSMR